jgi:hypothetical protein
MPQDILLTSDFDLMVKDGDFVIGDSTEQNKALLLIQEKGESRQFPDSTVGIQDWLDDDEVADLGAEIQKIFELDEMKIRKIEVYESGKIITDGNYQY